MKKYFPVFSSLIFLIGAPIFVFAQAVISPSIPGMTDVTANTPPGQYVASFYTFALMFGGVLAFGAVVYGGILYAISLGNPSQQSEGKEWIKSALIGLLLLAGAYLILFTINPDLVNLTMPTLDSVNIPTESGGSGTGGGTSNPFNGSGGGDSGGAGASNYFSVSDEIAALASSSRGADTSGGPGNGRVACAWAVNKILAAAGVAALDTNSVQSMENALTSGRGTLVNQSAAGPGDIVVQAQDGHVGICLNNGCTQVISNASGNSTFSWVSNTSFAPSYSGGPGRIYKLNP